MSGRRFRWGAVVVVSAIATSGACGVREGFEGADETHLEECVTDADCAVLGGGSPLCQGGLCTPANGPALGDASADADVPGLPDAAIEPSTDDSGPNPWPPVSQQNLGICTYPTAPRAQACGDQVLDPGGESCPPSGLVPPGETASALGACEASSADIGRVYGVSGADRVAMNATSVFVLDWLLASYRITAISKTDCSTTVLTEGTDSVSDMVATDESLFWTSVLPDGSAAVLESPPKNRSIAEDLAALVGVPTTSMAITYLTSEGQSLFGITWYAHPPEDPTTVGTALFEVPCCGGAARIVAQIGDLSNLDVGPMHFYDIDAGRFVLGGYGSYSTGTAMTGTLAFLDMASGERTTIYDHVSAAIGPFALAHGAVYLPMSEGIVELNMDTCQTTTIAADRLGTVPVMTATETHLYWAESYPDTDMSRIYAHAFASGESVELVQSSGQVQWLDVDDDHVYWSEQLSNGRQVLRTPVP